MNQQHGQENQVHNDSFSKGATNGVDTKNIRRRKIDELIYHH